MSIPEFCERIQDVWLSRVISGSTWGYPVVGALHVLAIAVFGGAVLVTHLRAFGFVPPSLKLSASDLGLRMLKAAGLTAVLATGALLFAAGAARYYESMSFRIKMVLLVLILMNSAVASRDRRARFARLHSGIALALWAAVIFAARGIAFF